MQRFVITESLPTPHIISFGEFLLSVIYELSVPFMGEVRADDLKFIR
jgi:hypothetical protein